MFSISFNSGALSFEVSGSDRDWVDSKFQKLEELMGQAAGGAENSQSKLARANVEEQESTKVARVNRKKQTKDRSVVDPSLKGAFNEALIDQLNAFINDRSKAFSKGATKQAAILAVFLKDTLGMELVGPADLEFIYRKIGWGTINHVSQLNNARVRDRFFTQNQGKLELTHSGLKFGRDASKDSASSNDTN